MREYRNRICSAVLAAVCVIGTALIPSRAVHAEDVVDPIAVQKQAAYDAVPETNGLENWPQGPHVYANSAIVMEMNSGAILYGKKINDKHYPASITKLLTALVALENADPDDEVYFSEDSVSFLEYGDASIGMRPGEILSMNDALYGMLLASANEVDKAHGTADHIITHVIVQRGKPRAERTDRLILGNRVFYIVDIDDTGSLGVSTLYYAEERTDVK